MGRPCSVCTHPKRLEIDRALVAGEPLRAIARRFGVSKDALRRHREHLPTYLARATEAREAAQAGDLLAQIQDLRDRALRILDKAESSRDLRVSLQAIREARQCVELLAKLAGELSEAPQVNILLSPQWVKLRKTILIALEPFPEARAKVAEVLSHGGG